MTESLENSVKDKTNLILTENKESFYDRKS